MTGLVQQLLKCRPRSGPARVVDQDAQREPSDPFLRLGHPTATLLPPSSRLIGRRWLETVFYAETAALVAAVSLSYPGLKPFLARARGLPDRGMTASRGTSSFHVHQPREVPGNDPGPAPPALPPGPRDP